MRCTASFYLPRPLPPEPVPAIVVACGHGGSKSAAYAQYAGQLYAKLGFAVIVPDMIGEAVRDLEAAVGGANDILTAAGMRSTIRAEIVAGANHRPFFLGADAVRWLQEHLDHRPVPIPAGRRTFGDWADAEGVTIEPLYDTPERERGLEVVDVGARYRQPGELACFPDARPSREYTMQGWVDGYRGE